LLKKRIIPCLDVKNGEVVKGTNFINLISAGNAVELAKKYYDDGADELVFLDITATEEKRKTITKLADDVGKVLRIPYTIGGGVNSLEDIEELLKAGADKVSMNSSIVKNPKLISMAAKQFGTQAIVAAVDVKKENDKYFVYVKGGKERTELDAYDWCKKVVDLGAGEILLTSMDKDGTKEGYDLELLSKITDLVNVPVIASGGAGTKEDFYNAFTYTKVTGCLAAGLFHFNKLKITDLKIYLNNKGVAVRL
jgi:cyclase